MRPLSLLAPAPHPLAVIKDERVAPFYDGWWKYNGRRVDRIRSQPDDELALRAAPIPDPASGAVGKMTRTRRAVRLSLSSRSSPHGRSSSAF